MSKVNSLYQDEQQQAFEEAVELAVQERTAALAARLCEMEAQAAADAEIDGLRQAELDRLIEVERTLTAQRDALAAANAWQPIEIKPSKAMGVLLYVPMEHTDEVPHGQCYCIQIAFYDPGWSPTPGFYEQGTGHGYYEREQPWGDGNTPTHWMPLPERPLPAPPAANWKEDAS